MLIKILGASTAGLLIATAVTANMLLDTREELGAKKRDYQDLITQYVALDNKYDAAVTRINQLDQLASKRASQVAVLTKANSDMDKALQQAGETNAHAKTILNTKLNCTLVRVLQQGAYSQSGGDCDTTSEQLDEGAGNNTSGNIYRDNSGRQIQTL